MKPGLFSILEKIAATEAPKPETQEFLDSHFSLKRDWRQFKNKLVSKKFVEAVKNDPRADKKLQRYVELNGKHMQAKGGPVYPVPSMTGTGSYNVKYHSDLNRFSCNCGDWVHQRSWRKGQKTMDCKHIKAVKSDLKAYDVNPADLKKKQ